MIKKAFQVTTPTFPNMIVIVAAINAIRARYHCYLSANDAGFDIPYIDFRARRKPEFDHLAEKANNLGWELGWIDGDESWGCMKTEKRIDEQDPDQNEN